MPYLGNMTTQAHYCLGSPAVTPFRHKHLPSSTPPPGAAGRDADLREVTGPQRGYLLAAQLMAMTAIIWAVFSSAAFPSMSAHRSHETWQ
jgi:hypothetical protein